MLNFYVVDLETLGLMPQIHEVFEISIIRASDKVQFTRKIKVKHPKNANADALAITGKTYEDLLHGVSAEEAIADADNFFAQDGASPNHRVMVGHNVVNFDRKFLHSEWSKVGKYFPANMFLDTMTMSKRMTAKMGQPKASVKLANAMDLFGLKKYSGLHSAKGDTRNTFVLWRHLVDSGIDYLDLIKQLPHAPLEVEDMGITEFEDN